MATALDDLGTVVIDYSAGDNLDFRTAGQPHIVLAYEKDEFYKKKMSQIVLSAAEIIIGGRYIMLVSLRS